MPGQSSSPSVACRCLAVALALAALAAPAAPAHAQSDCVALQRVVGLAHTRFQRLRGFFDPRLDGWVSTYRMRGASVCTIHDTPDTAYYACTWNQDPRASTVPALYAELRERVTGCLEVRETRELAPDEHSQVTRFGLASGRETVVVGRSEQPDDAAFVTLEILPLGIGDLPSP